MPSSHIQKAICNWAETVDHLCNRIQEEKIEFDLIVVRGISGLLVGPAIAHKLEKNFAVVRKPKAVETSHAYIDIESNTNDSNRYIIVDDLIDSGETVLAIDKAIRNVFPCATLVCVALYNPIESLSFKFKKKWSETHGVELALID